MGTAALCCCTKIHNGWPYGWKWPLTWARSEGLEPARLLRVNCYVGTVLEISADRAPPVPASRTTAFVNRICGGPVQAPIIQNLYHTARRETMSAIDNLKAAETLQFDGILYHFHVSVPGIDDMDVTTGPFCVTKSRGMLALMLDSNQLNLPVPGQTFQFAGTANGNQVTWVIDQPLDIWFSGAHLSRAHGQIVTRVDEVSPSLDTDCSGNRDVEVATLTTVGSDNAVSIDTDPAVASATLSNISAQGVRCSEPLSPVFFDVRIHPNKTSSDGCEHYFEDQGSTVRFTAWVEDLIAVGPVTGTTYSWTVPPGVAVNGPMEQATIEIVLNDTGSVSLTCRVVVTTTLESGANQSTVTFSVLSAHEAAHWRLFCDLLSLDRRLPSLLFPGDPAFPRAPSLHVLYQVRVSAGRIAEVASELARLTTVVIEQREAQIEGRIRSALEK